MHINIVVKIKKDTRNIINIVVKIKKNTPKPVYEISYTFLKY